MDGPGTMSWDEFLENAESFVRVANEISDGWELRGEKTIPGRAYLYRRVKTFVPSNYLADDFSLKHENERKTEVGEKAKEDNDGGAIDDPYEANYETEQPFVTEHHILWYMSYGVPVIYFNAWFSDFPGVNRVSVTKAQRIVPDDILGYGELSQAIHPILGTTYLHLHPCKSHELLSIMSKSNNKLVSWLSVVSPAALNLKISLRYCELTLRNKSKDEKSTISEEQENNHHKSSIIN